MRRPVLPVRFAQVILVLLLAEGSFCSPGWTAEPQLPKLHYDLGFEEISDLPEFLRPLQEMCRRLHESQGEGVMLVPVRVEVSEAVPSRLISIRFRLYHDIYCTCCNGEKAIPLTDEDLDVLRFYPSLEALDLDAAAITGRGLRKLLHLKKLRELDLRNTKIVGEDLEIVAELTSLERLNLRGIELQTEDLRSLVALKKLQELTLRPPEPRHLGDAVLEILGQLPELRRLPYSPTTNSGLEHIAGLRKLNALDCYSLRITDRGLAHLSGMTNLTSLTLSSASITEAGLSHLRNMTKLRWLLLDRTDITDDALVHLSGMTRLEEIHLSNTAITDEGLRHLSNCKRLRQIYLDGTNTTGKGLQYLDPQTPLQGSYPEFPATAAGVVEINRFKTWHRLLLDVHGTCPTLEISSQPDLKQLRVKLIGDAEKVRIADCPALKELHINCEQSTPALKIQAIQLESLPALEKLVLLNVVPEGFQTQEALTQVREVELGGATNTVVLSALPQCSELARINMWLGKGELTAVTGDPSLLDRLPPLKKLTDMSVWGYDSSATLVLKLLRNAEALKYPALELKEVTAADLEPLLTCDQVREFRLNGQRYTRSFKPKDDKPWYMPPQQAHTPDSKSKTSKAYRSREQSPTRSHASSEPISPGNPWSKLADMPGKLGRFELASDGRHIYRLGGISYNIRSGGSYSRGFAVFDPVSQTWTLLPPAPFGTGGACLEYWPEKQCFVATAGIVKLGNAFQVEGAVVGIYDVAEKRWSTKQIACPGLGRVARLAHSNKGRFLVLTSDRTLSSGKKVAVLDLDDESLQVVGDCPVTGRMVGKVRIEDTLFVLQGKSRTPCRLHRFDANNGQHLGSVELKEEFTHVDTLFAWGQSLFIWKNSGPYDRNQYEFNSTLLRMEPATGCCVPVHAEFSGPRARRSSTGVMCGNAFYVFGGQRTDSIWLSDAYRYSFDD